MIALEFPNKAVSMFEWVGACKSLTRYLNISGKTTSIRNRRRYCNTSKLLLFKSETTASCILQVKDENY